jgi:hypothetical protein
MKQRTAEDGRKLVAAFKESGLSKKDFAKETGNTVCSLQYWQRRLKQTDGNEADGSQNRFVEITVPSEGVGALKMSVGDLHFSFSRLPAPSWMSEFVTSFENRK